MTAAWSLITSGSGLKHQTITDPVHLAAARALRKERLEVVRPAGEQQVEQRDLADYDRLLGIDGGVA